MPDLVTYGSTDPVYFKLTLDGAGVVVTLATGDVTISKDGAAFANVNTLPTSIGNGWYSWTPSSTELECEQAILNIADASGSAFDENGILIHTGGDVNAYHSG
jgi:hypothetical protein